MHEPYAIETAALTKSYGSFAVLRGIDLRVAYGSIFALLGANGAGKTTLIRILATLTRPTSGRAQVAGFDVAHAPQEVQRRISLTGQNVAVDALQTGAENLRMLGELAGLSRAQARQRANDLLKEFALTEVGSRQVGTYSGGMRRRLDIAASLVNRPPLIFLDEPTVGLDPRSRKALWNLIKELGAAGITIFLTTQYLEEADLLADHIAVLDGGYLVAEGSADALKQRVAGQRLDMTFVDNAAYATAQRHLASRIIFHDHAERILGVTTDGSATQVRTILDEIDPQRHLVQQFTIQTATLDDVFFALTGRTKPQDAQEVAHV